MQNFYAADGGRAGYANGMLVDEDDEEEYIRSGAGQSRRQQNIFKHGWWCRTSTSRTNAYDGIC